MKKIMFLILVISLCVSSSAFATDAAISGVSDTQGQIMKAATPASLDIARASKGVYFGWQTSVTGYSVNTYHMSGTKFYGTSYDSTQMFFSDVGVNATLVAPTSSVSDDAFSGWTSM